MGGPLSFFSSSKAAFRWERQENMKQKIVIKVQMNCDKCRTKALKVAAVAHGVSSVAIEGEEKDKVVVIGDGVDSVCLARSLRKKVAYATLVSVEEVKTKPEDKPEVKIQYCSTPCISTSYQYPPLPMYQVVCDPDPSNCSIM